MQKNFIQIIFKNPTIKTNINITLSTKRYKRITLKNIIFIQFNIYFQYIKRNTINILKEILEKEIRKKKKKVINKKVRIDIINQ